MLMQFNVLMFMFYVKVALYVFVCSMLLIVRLLSSRFPSRVLRLGGRPGGEPRVPLSPPDVPQQGELPLPLLLPVPQRRHPRPHPHQPPEGRAEHRQQEPQLQPPQQGWLVARFWVGA